MTALVDLDVILRRLKPRLRPEHYVFATIRHNAPVPLTAASMMREDEGISLVMQAADARALGLETTYPCRLITLDVPSSLESIGLIAVIARAFADAQISLNPVSAFHHDHIFVPVDRADEALAILRTLSDAAR